MYIPCVADKTNMIPPTPDFKPPTKPVALGKRKRQEEFSCSPLFATPPRLKKKGFISSACDSNLKGQIFVLLVKYILY